MSKIERNLCSALLKEYFGEIVQQVADYILKSGSKPLYVIKADTKLPLLKVKQALYVLVQHNFASFNINEKHRYVEYAVHAEKVLLIARYPRYVFCIKAVYGDIAELIAEEIIENGQLTLEQIIKNVLDRVNENTSEDQSSIKASAVHDRFTDLANTHFIQRCPNIFNDDETAEKIVPTFAVNPATLYDIPKVDLEILGRKRKLPDESKGGESSSKRIKLENSSVNPDPIYWKINFDRFHNYFRDELIVKAISNKLGWKMGQVYEATLKLAETKTEPFSSNSIPISKHELYQYMTKNNSNISLKELDQYLAVLVDDTSSGFMKLEDSGGGTYSINYTVIIYNLLVTTLHSVVQERFGSKSARIFRLILLKNYLEQKQIEELAMIPAKDAKELTYKMFQDNFLEVQEIPKTPDYAPSRTFYFFHVNLLQLSRMILEHSYKSVFNAISRREMVLKEHKRLLEKKQRVDAIIATLKQSGGDEAQLKEVEDSITPPEQLIISKANSTAEKLEQAELQLDETISILQLAIQYEVFKVKL